MCFWQKKFSGIISRSSVENQPEENFRGNGKIIRRHLTTFEWVAMIPFHRVQYKGNVAARGPLWRDGAGLPFCPITVT